VLRALAGNSLNFIRAEQAAFVAENWKLQELCDCPVEWNRQTYVLSAVETSITAARGSKEERMTESKTLNSPEFDKFADSYTEMLDDPARRRLFLSGLVSTRARLRFNGRFHLALSGRIRKPGPRKWQTFRPE